MFGMFTELIMTYQDTCGAECGTFAKWDRDNKDILSAIFVKPRIEIGQKTDSLQQIRKSVK